MENHKLRIKEKLGFFSFSFASNILFSYKGSYYKYFLTSVLLINPISVSNVVLIGMIWDILNDPLVGVWAGNVRFRSGEKVRPWILWTALPIALGTILIFTDFKVNERLDIILAIICFFIYELANTFRGIPYNGMGTLATADDGERKVLNSLKSLGVALGVGVGGIFTPFIIKAFGGLKDHSVINSSDSLAVFKTSIVVAVIMFAGCLIHYFTSEERIRESKDDEKKLDIIESYKILFRCRSWVINLIYIMTYGIISTLNTSAVVYQCSYVLNNSSLMSPIMGSFLLSSMVASLLAPKIDTLLGRKRTMIAAAVIQIIGKIPFIINPYSVLNNVITVMSVGLGLSISFVMFNTNRSTIADIVAIKNGKRLDTMVSTADNLATKVAEASVDKLFLVALGVAGFSAELSEKGLMQNQATQNVITSMLGWIPGLAALMMLITALFLDVQKEYQETIAEYKENSAD
ncbi:MAG: MFS transporter [Erysipelotrichaceae bacterium]|nr:MFS transporter [Erysipelotrichaceae bacterium]